MPSVGATAAFRTAPATLLALSLLSVSATVSAGAQSSHAPSGTLAVVNQAEHSVEFVDPATHRLLGAVPVGVNGHEIAASPDGKLLYVPIYGNAGVGRPGTDGHEIAVIDPAARKLVATIDLGKPLRPHKPLFGPDGKLYVSGELDQAIEVIDPATRKVVATLPTGAPESHMFALSRDGRRAYTTNVDAGSVSVIDVPARKTISIIPLTKRVQRIAVSDDGRWVFTSDWDQPRIAVLDTRTNALSRWVPTGGLPYVTQPTPDGNHLLVAETRDGKGLLEVIDLRTWKSIRTFPLEPVLENGGFLIHGDRAFLSEPHGGAIAVLHASNWSDPATYTLEEPIKLTEGVDGLAWVP